VIDVVHVLQKLPVIVKPSHIDDPEVAIISGILVVVLFVLKLNVVLRGPIICKHLEILRACDIVNAPQKSKNPGNKEGQEEA
jgi:hypothetical protein